MFLPASTAIQSGSETPRRWMLVLHGIYGRGANWRSFARRFCDLEHDRGVLLVDLRMHGASLEASPPHTIRACADDVMALIDDQERRGRKLSGIVGHSFGGKVALEVRRLCPRIEQSWIIDSSPSSRPANEKSTVRAVLAMLKALPVRFNSREDFVTQVQASGYPLGLAQWLAMNLESQAADGYRNTLDLDAMQSLLDDYWQRDLWESVESPGSELHFVVASRNSVVSRSDAERLRSAAGVSVHQLDGGHWLHVDALDGLVSLIAAGD